MKRFQSIGVLLSFITGLLVLLLVAVFANSARQAYEQRQAAIEMLSSVQIVRDIYAMAEFLHIEDGRVRMALSASGPAVANARDEKAVDLVLSDLIAGRDAPADVTTLRTARMTYDQLFGKAFSALDQPE